MTGYGAQSAKLAGTEISVVVKSVNGRFLETRFHLPKEFFKLESQMKKMLSQCFHRGTVDVFVHKRNAVSANVKLNPLLAKKWANAYKDLGQLLQVPSTNSQVLNHIASMPQIFEVREQSDVSKKELSVFQNVFAATLRRCDAERLREGRSIRLHLTKLLKSLRAVVGKIEVLREKSHEAHSVRLNERLRRAGLDNQTDPARFSQELILYLEKCDIAEELERLKEHVQMCDRYLRAKEEQGKKLDFYTQELLREVNTIGSKANSAPITEQVVLAKGLIEAFKEQVQNIE